MLINVKIQPDKKWVTEAEVDEEVEEIIADDVAAMVVPVGNLATSRRLLSIQHFIWVLVIIKS